MILSARKHPQKTVILVVKIGGRNERIELLGVPTVIASGDLSNVAGSPTPYYGTIVLYKAYYPVWLCFGQSPHEMWYGITNNEIYDLTSVTWKRVTLTDEI